MSVPVKMSQPMSVMVSKKTQEWFTPETPYIHLVREVFDGLITLDPASSQLPQSWIKANFWYGLDHPQEYMRDGLNNPWDVSVNKKVNIFNNPPYNGKTSQWVRKAEKEYANSAKLFDTQVIVLCNSNFGYKWWEEMFEKWTCCLVRERIRFIDENGKQGGQAKKASAFCYLGDDKEKFAKIFRHLGRITFPEK